ncbi:PilZ domain-containing protein [Geothrix sp. 21YS21S-4]|uniref:PilZ domain-containing protein n=1 Tax=Geothrix sp. 21YS21S-4 TaxID=3068889 RepID=UPI0027BA0613|nr:PilZ domain-containing protein [Geothrix sp. 21YS21S-4]
MDDPAQIRKALLDLLQAEAEFPIKVEGTHTLPYTASVKHLDQENGLLHLRLIRPLPHEMAAGAPFEMLFALGDQRFEAPITFMGRESYLLYRFTLPTQMVQSDRRAHKRYPFRPREKAYVTAQDAGWPGYGLAGPLVNLSLGGLAFRVDRILRLDDHLRVTPGTGFFERGKELPQLKIRDLPKHPLFEGRGRVANAWERDGEITVGVQFMDLKDSELRLLQDVITIREQMQKASSVSGPSAPAPRPGAKAEVAQGPATRMDPAGALTPDALLRLRRRSAPVILALRPGTDREGLLAVLAGAGYLRLEVAASLDAARDLLRANQGAPGRLLLVEAAEGAPPLEELRALLGDRGDLGIALLHREAPLPETAEPFLRPVEWPAAAETAWLLVLDELAGF